jgi:formamidase
MNSLDIYTAVAIQTVPTVVYKRKDIEINLKRALEILDSVVYASPTAKAPDMLVQYEPYAPVKVVAFSEDFLQGFTMKANMATHVKEIAITIPGPETDFFAERARKLEVYIYAVALEILPQWPDRIFNCAFIISPEGKIIHKYHKFSPSIHYELSTSPHEVLDEYLDVFGKGKTMHETLFPVTKTPIGNLGTIICNDGYHPEYFRAVALNGAEIIFRPNLAEPAVYKGWWEFTNRAAALTNLCYVIAPDLGGIIGPEHVRHMQAGQSMIVDYDGQIVSQLPYPDEGCVSGTIRLEHLRERRVDPSRNFPTLLRTEVLREVYSKTIYPPNLLTKKDAIQEFKEMYKKDTRHLGVIEEFFKRGIYTKPKKWKT